MRYLATAAALLAVSACNGNPATNNATVSTEPAVAPSKPADPQPAAALSKPVDPQLAARMDELVRAESALLPRQVDPVTTHQSIHREGAEIVNVMTLNQALSMPVDQARATLEPQQRTALCAVPELASLLSDGAIVRYDYTSSDGTRFQTRLTSCT